MPAGLIFTGRIWRMTDSTDDEVGGAVPTGTIIHPSIRARISAMKPTQALLDQGLETPELFSAIFYPGGLGLQHNDQFEVVTPKVSEHYGKRFVIIGLQHSSMEDKRRHQIVTMRRIEKAHGNLLQ